MTETEWTLRFIRDCRLVLAADNGTFKPTSIPGCSQVPHSSVFDKKNARFSRKPTISICKVSKPTCKLVSGMYKII